MNNFAPSTYNPEIIVEIPITRVFLEQLVTDIFFNICDGNIQQVLNYGDQYSSATFMSNVFEDIFIYIHQFGDDVLDDYDLKLISKRIEDTVRHYFITKAKGNEPELQILRKEILGIISLIYPNYEYSREELYEG